MLDFVRGFSFPIRPLKDKPVPCYLPCLTTLHHFPVHIIEHCQQNTIPHREARENYVLKSQISLIVEFRTIT